MIAKIIENSLPVWFHELSNPQLASVERLQYAIARDLRYKTICNVQDVFAKLGLVLRPNHIYVKRAVQNCCGCPIRCLTLIYLYRRRKRADSKEYDLNDRILLSAIVHLILPTLLREMHVRMPSPPPREKPKPTPNPCKPKKKKYPSPYLEPYTFERDPPKHTGIYKNPHIQYPESPYFIYLEQYYYDMYINQLGSEEDLHNKHKRRKRKHKRHTEDKISAIDAELNYERDRAQRKYEQLFPGKFTPKLLRASIYPKCIVRTHEELEFGDEVYEVEAEMPKSDGKPEDPIPDVVNYVEEDEDLCEEEGSEESTPMDMDQFCKDRKKKRKRIYRHPLSMQKDCECTQDKDKADSSDSESSTSSPSPTFETPNYENPNFEEGSEEYSQGSVSFFLNEPPEKNYPMYSNVIPICGGVIFHPKYKYVPIITGIIAPDLLCGCNVEPPEDDEEVKLLKRTNKHKPTGECTCIELFLKRQKKDKEFRKLKREIKKLCTCKICTCKDRVPRTPSPVASIADFVPPSDDIYQKPEEERLIEIKEPPPFVCKCKDIVNQQIVHSEHVEKQEEKNPKRSFVIADLTDDGKKIVSGVRDPKRCKCLEKYRERVEKFEKHKRIELTQQALKSAKRVFCFGGVRIGPDGKPIYMISAVCGTKLCGKCVEREMDNLKEEQRKAEMAMLPTGRVQYQISGVRKTPQGNVFILSGALASDPCNCMKLYDTFMMMHSKCMQVYHRYMEKMEADTKEYLEEMGSLQTTSTSYSSSSTGKPEKDQPCSTTTPSSSTSSSTKKSSPPSTPGTSSEGCVCGPFPKDSTESVEEEIVEEVHEEEVEEEEEEVQDCFRYLILKEIPRDRPGQVQALQRVLSGLAMDGFPIADLPGVHKLPHFRIWMALRTNSFWTMEDREALMAYSKTFWSELGKCRMPVQTEGLAIPENIARKYTFANAEFVKKWTDAIKEHQYRKVKLALIQYGREFFPSMCDYELPTSTFRDCYFAYVPSHEEAVFPRFPWASFEFRNYSKMREKRKSKQQATG